ncbi:MAG TPA: HAD family hydrolase [Steroidobacteraceae bacterium]|nr:HAD family hydrolase [Steroidobacteraceae bacterium]
MRPAAVLHAAIFDIDGTLLDSCGIDDSLFSDAVRKALGAVRIRDGWHEYARVTDTGILADICSDNSLAYDASVSLRVMNVYFRSLLDHIQVNGPYREIPGALQYLNALRARADVRVAYATGGWGTTARHKLASAGFPLDGIPLACADDHPDRMHIMLQALGRLEGPFASVTYFGDGVWDQSAAARLGWGFVAVGPKLDGISDFGALPPQLFRVG